MATVQKDRHIKTAQKAFEMVQYFPSRYVYSGPQVYTVIEAIGTNTASGVIHQYSDHESIVKGPVAYQPDQTRYFGRARPPGHANRFEGQKQRPINCDEALKRYGGVLIKEFR